jgi:hypothetical protein
MDTPPNHTTKPFIIYLVVFSLSAVGMSQTSSAWVRPFDCAKLEAACGETALAFTCDEGGHTATCEICVRAYTPSRIHTKFEEECQTQYQEILKSEEISEKCPPPRHRHKAYEVIMVCQPPRK